ncbi:MAG TPA: acyl carrier protein [Planctomycetota bacterium]|nr:acyl carrier protein [Planctomycetota bacterium]
MAERIEDKIKAMIVERLFLNVAPGDIADDDPLMTKYEIDSVRLFEIVIGIEEIFGITFEDEEFSLEAFETVAAISSVVRNKLG